MHTAYGKNICPRCGLPAGIHSGLNRICPSCQARMAWWFTNIIRPYLVKHGRNTEAPRDCYYQYIDAAAKDYGVEGNHDMSSLARTVDQVSL